jgi:hypothetical protein
MNAIDGGETALKAGRKRSGEEARLKRWSRCPHHLRLAFHAIAFISCRSTPGVTGAEKTPATSPSILVVPKEAKARTTYFDKLVLSLPANQKYGQVKAGLLCEKSRDLVWGHSPTLLTEPDVRTAFNDVMERGNYPVIGKAEALFEDFSKTDLVVAALIKKLEMDVCSRFNMNVLLMPFMKTNETQVTTTTSLKVDWKVFDVQEKRVVYETMTQAVLAESVKITTVRGLIIAAFGRATEALAADQRFFDLVTKGMNKT